MKYLTIYRRERPEPETDGPLCFDVDTVPILEGGISDMVTAAQYVEAGKELLAYAERNTIPYTANGMSLDGMDCQGLNEYLLMQCGYTAKQVGLAGSNAHWRKSLSWRGTVAECVKAFGRVPGGAWLFIHTPGHNEKYGDEDGDAWHMGVYLEGTTALHASASRKQVAESTFKSKAINGGWNMVGLCKWIDYGVTAEGQSADLATGTEAEITMTLYDARVETENKKGVYMRKSASANAAAMVTVPYGALVQVLTVQGEWSQTRFENYTGWIMSQYLTAVGSGAATDDTADTPAVLTSGYGVWIPCASLENAKAVQSLLTGATVKSV